MHCDTHKVNIPGYYQANADSRPIPLCCVEAAIQPKPREPVSDETLGKLIAVGLR